MDRVQEKGKKSKPSFKDDLKNLKENLKIREILRTVKMNSSMRLKAPPGSKVMDNRDFIDNENVLEPSTAKSEQEKSEIYVSSATNPNVIFDISILESDKDIIDATNKNINIKDIDNETFEPYETSNTTNIVIDSETESQPNNKQEQQSNTDEDTIKKSEKPEQSVVSSESLTLLSSKQQPMEQTEKQSKSCSEKIEGLSEELLIENEVKKTFEENECDQISEDHGKYNSKENSKEQLEMQLKNDLKEEYRQETRVSAQEYSKDNSEYESGHQLKEQEIKSQELSVEHIEQQYMELPDQCKEKNDEQFENITEVHDVKPNDQQQTSEVQPEVEDESQSNDQIEGKSSENFETKPNVDPEAVSPEEHCNTELAKESNSFNEVRTILNRNRKLSWDHTMLSRREGLSQSEVDLHSIGKLPLERKSSFFRKKMDSFLRNTTEMFKKQSFSAKSESIQRRGSMSISLQSLNETADSFKRDYNEDSMGHKQKEETPGSVSSVISSSTLGRSNSTLSGCQSEALNPEQGAERSLVGSQPVLCVTPALGDSPSNSVHSLNESYLHDSLLKNRAISMSSGLDSQSWLRRKKSTSKSNRSNRVTWVASEGVTNYFRRMIQDENRKNIQEGQPYQDCSSIPEHKSDKSYGKNDTKGRRWSYQRAVSGEDPTPPSRYQESSLRRKPLTEHSEESLAIARKLAEFQSNGVPLLRGFDPVIFTEEVDYTLSWAQNKENVHDFLANVGTARQAVLCELISTEAEYIRHLQVLVDVFIAAAHALQDEGLLMVVATRRLFLNLPDILNASRVFWETTFHHMIYRALAYNTELDPKLMLDGFVGIADIFEPYEKYAIHHPCANDYLRALMNHIDVTTYLTWCHSQKVCQRLQISDLLVKPIQRVTKYTLILKRIAQHTEDDEERQMILTMDQSVKTYVCELNRSVKQHQELGKFEYNFSGIENYDVDFLQANFQEFKEDVDEYTYHMFTQSNLRAPMLNCHSQHSRTVIHEGDLRFKDGNKEIEVRAILYTDLLIICKKQSKGSPYQYKMIRPKYMIDKLVDFPKYGVRNNVMELTVIFIVMVDEFGSCHTCFTLTESSKDPNGSDTLKLWEQKIKEAQYTYNLAVWLYRNPSYHISDLEQELASDYGSGSAKQKQLSQEEYNIEREAKERVVTMMHRTNAWTSSLSTDHSHESSDIVSMSITGRDCTPTGRRVPGIDVLQNRWKLAYTGYSSRSSTMSTFQKSMSAASHDECQPACNRHLRRAGSSIENTQPSVNKDDGLSTVTVKVMEEGENESELSSTTNPTPGTSGYSGQSSASSNKLQVKNTVVALVHSLPDLTFMPIMPRKPQRGRSPSPVSAAEKLYQIHQDHLKSRLTINSKYLTPDSRGISYPPTSPGRASLRRGLAFSYSFSKPTLTKMRQVVSQNALDHIEQAPTPVPSPVKGPKERELSLEKPGFVAKYLTPGTSADKLDRNKEKEAKEKDKKSKLRRKKKNDKECENDHKVIKNEHKDLQTVDKELTQEKLMDEFEK